MTNAPFTVECRVGRVVEARLTTLRDASDVARWQEAMRAAFVQAGRKCVVCADLRAMNLLAPTVADLMIGVLEKGNAHVDRSAILVPLEGASLHLQAERIVRGSRNPARRTFRDAGEMAAWLGEVLDDTERTRVRAFLAVSG